MKKEAIDRNGVVENGHGTDGLNVRRPVYQLEDLNRDTEYETPHTTCNVHRL
jgi:hypothetical protein